MSGWLACAYAALALGLGWALVGRGGWKRRVPFIVCAPALALALWLGRADPAGWPTAATLPKQATLVWAQVDEPDPSAADPGRIYLWLNTGRPAPRAYSLPYTRSLHEQVQKALKALRRGDPIRMARVTRAPRPPRGLHSARGGKAPASTAQNTGVVRLYAQPPVLLPPKTN